MDQDAGGWHKLVRLLGDARGALQSNDYAQALASVDAAIALDDGFLAAHILREEIVERMRAQPVELPAAVQSPDTDCSPDPATAVIAAAQPTTETEPAPSSRGATAARVMTLAAVLVLIAGLAAAFRTAKVATPVPPSSGVVVPAPASIAVFPARVATTAQPALADVSASVPAWTSPRLTQLDVRPHWRASAMHVEDAALLRDLEEGVSELWIGKAAPKSDAIFVGAIDGDQWAALGASLKRHGVVWVIDPIRSRAGADAFTTAAAAAGFVPIKHLRYSAAFTATQFASRR